MKKITVAFLLCIVIANYASGQKNLFNNGNFEDDLTGWSANADIKTSSFVHYEGKNAAVIFSLKNDAWIGMDQTVKLPKKAEAIELSFAAQSLNIQHGAKDWNKGVVIVEFQSGGQKMGDGINLLSLDGTHNWKRVTKQLVVPQNANSFRLMIAMNECTGTMYIDDVQATVISLSSIPGQEPKNPLVAIKSDISSTPLQLEIKKQLVDKNSINAATKLYYNLKKNSTTHILFGQQDATKSGIIDSIHFWSNEQQNDGISRNRSDIKTLTGNYPAVYGFDFAKATDTVKGKTWYSYEKNIMRELVIDAYNRNGVVTFCWHVRNPVTDSSFYWDKSPVEAVSQILPGGKYNEKFNGMLQQLANYNKLLVDKDGQWIPIIFRPWHEMDGNWFWWGADHCTPEQYKELYRYTVSYLKDKLGVHNMLFAWSPDRNFTNEEEYLKYYPGDDNVDLVGMDEYEDMKPQYPIEIAANKIKIVSDYAQKHNKLAALTETGLEGIKDSTWFTERLLKALTLNKVQLSYVLIWANTSWAYWIPYKGHPAENNFLEFVHNPLIQLSNNMPNLYQTIK